eukprot:8015-Heterococcus_DN1.PRE.1
MESASDIAAAVTRALSAVESGRLLPVVRLDNTTVLGKTIAAALKQAQARRYTQRTGTSAAGSGGSSGTSAMDHAHRRSAAVVKCSSCVAALCLTDSCSCVKLRKQTECSALVTASSSTGLRCFHLTVPLLRLHNVTSTTSHMTITLHYCNAHKCTGALSTAAAAALCLELGVHKVTGDLVHWFQTDTGVSPAELTWHIGPTVGPTTAQQGKAAADDSSGEVQPLEEAAAALDVDALVQRCKRLEQLLSVTELVTLAQTNGAPWQQCSLSRNDTTDSFNGAILDSKCPANVTVASIACMSVLANTAVLHAACMYLHTRRGLAQSALRSFRTAAATGTTTATTLSQQQQQHAAKLFAVPLPDSIPAQTRSRLAEPLCWELHLCSSSGVLSQSHLLCDGQSLLGFAQQSTWDSSSSTSSKDQQEVAVLPQELMKRLQVAAEGCTADITEVLRRHIVVPSLLGAVDALLTQATYGISTSGVADVEPRAVHSPAPQPELATAAATLATLATVATATAAATVATAA